MKNIIILVALGMITSNVAMAESNFKSGPLLQHFGSYVTVIQDEPLPADSKFKVAFDVGRQGANDSVNRSFDSLARFLNMHAAAGIKPENLNLALVIHGKAAFDVLNNQAYDDRFMQANPNQDLINALLKNNVNIMVCGQTAGFLKIGNNELMKGVKMSLSAMTAHALLQQQGYTLNPF